jgi:hypothetical protein
MHYCALLCIWVFCMFHVWFWFILPCIQSVQPVQLLSGFSSAPLIMFSCSFDGRYTRWRCCHRTRVTLLAGVPVDLAPSLMRPPQVLFVLLFDLPSCFSFGFRCGMCTAFSLRSPPGFSCVRVDTCGGAGLLDPGWWAFDRWPPASVTVVVLGLGPF